MPERVAIGALTVILALVLAPAALARGPLEGRWEGVIQFPDAPVPFDVDVRASADGALIADLTAAARGTRDAELLDLSLDGQSVRWVLGGVPGTPTFEGTMDGTGDRITGTLTMGESSLSWEMSRTGVARVAPAAVDAIFERFESTRKPGCSVAVSRNGELVFARAYGMADLEHDAPNTTATIFEAASIAKQFAAAATILLALDGELSLDDDIREYVPEVPDYGTPITIRHLMHHTSGLRSWGEITAVGGWPRTRRVHGLEHVLDITSRQRALNHEPGEYYSYTNTGYVLQAVLVERVTGGSFVDFCRKRLFEPLGMTRTEWRDDYQRLIRGRAVGYTPSADGFRLNMHFENVVGSGNLQTTPTDLLKFTRNLETGEVGGKSFIEEMHRQGVLNSGRTIHYASGLFVGEHRGWREVQHAGGTPGFSTYLTRYPEADLAVAVTCNVDDARAGQLAHEVADLYLGGDRTEGASESSPATVDVAPERLKALAGAYRRARDGRPITVWHGDDVLRVRGVALAPESDSRFRSENGTLLEFSPQAKNQQPSGRFTWPDGTIWQLEPVPEFEPTGSDLREYVGMYTSEEAEVELEVTLDDGRLSIEGRYGERLALAPAYPDVFIGEDAWPGTVYAFHRHRGRVTELSFVNDRIWDLRLQRKRDRARGGRRR